MPRVEAVDLKRRNEWIPRPQKPVAIRLGLILMENPLLGAVAKQLIPLDPASAVITLFNFEGDSFPPADKRALPNWGGMVYLYPSAAALAEGKNACDRKIIFQAVKPRAIGGKERTAKVVQVGRLAFDETPIAVRCNLPSPYYQHSELKGIFIGDPDCFPNLSYYPRAAIRIVSVSSGQLIWLMGVIDKGNTTVEPYANYNWRKPNAAEHGLFKLEVSGDKVSLTATPAFEAAPGFKFEIDKRYLPSFKD